MTDIIALRLRVNDREHDLRVDPDETLLTVLRDRLDLVGTRFGCGQEQCGACMVLVDDEAIPSCARPAALFAGRRIETVEGLGTPAAPHPLQTAFLAEQAGQCGYCLSGILISAAALLRRRPNPDRSEVVEALEPNLCRCGTQNRIIRAVLRAAAERPNGPTAPDA